MSKVLTVEALLLKKLKELNVTCVPGYIEQGTVKEEQINYIIMEYLP